MPEAVSGTGGSGSLPRRLGVVSAAAVLVGSTIGSGIFRVPSEVAASVGSTELFIAVWVAGALIALFGALTLAELAAALPRSGGIYAFLREAYGPLPAFLFGWTQLVVVRPSALGAISLICASYLGAFVPLGEAGVRWAAMATIVLVGLVNIRSVRWGAWLENVTTGTKVVALLVVSGLAFLLAAGPPASPAAPPETHRVAGMGIALVAVMWAYDGWADLTYLAGEVRDPGRTLPRALIGGVLIVAVVYLLVNAAYLQVVPLPEMAASDLVAAEAAMRIAGQAGASLVAGLVVLSTFGSLNGAMMTGPRIFFAMARDDLMFGPIAAVHSRYRTPHAAIGLATLLGVGFVSARSFEELAGAFILGIWPFYVLAVAATIRLRRRRPDLARPYRMPGYPSVPAIFLLASGAMLLDALIAEPLLAAASFGVILAGIPVFFGWRRVRRARPAVVRASTDSAEGERGPERR